MHVSHLTSHRRSCRNVRTSTASFSQRSHRVQLRSPAARQQHSVRAGAAQAAAPLETLQEAGKTKQVPADEVIKAMDSLEAQHSKVSLVEGFPASLQGTWRLVFATPGPPLIKSWQYIPVKEDIEIDLAAGSIAMVGELGPLCNRFSGHARFEADPEAGGYRMVFGWDTLTTTFFSFKSIKQLPAKEKVYTFITLQPDAGIAIANSSTTGGKTLMVRVTEQ